MKKNNNIAIFVMLMILGLSNINYGVSQAAEPMIFKAEENNENELKANKETLDLAKSAMDQKNYARAIDYLTTYINSKPKKYEPYKMRGKCYYALHKFDLAENDFKTAIDIKTSDDKFITGAKVISAVVLGADKQEQYQNTELGNLYGDLMYAQKAQNKPEYEDTYKKAFEYNSHIYLPTPQKDDILKINCPQKYGKILNPTGIDADIADVINNIESGNYHEAGYKISNITNEYPQYYFGHYLAGVVMAGLEQDKDAIKSFENALKYNPEDFESLASLGQIYYSEAEKTFNKDNAQKSIEYFNKALKYSPNNPKYHYYIGLNNLLMGNLENSINEFNSAIAQKENDYNSIYYKLLAQQMKGEYNSVIEGSTKLLNKRVSNSNSVLYLRALAYFNQDNYELAMADIDKVFSNMNDIYNSDIKRTSAKEKTLENYLYLLKAQIEEKQGTDNSDSLEKAYENPIIKSLSNSNNSDITVNSYDIENQYDYIRTAFKKPVNVIYDGFEYRLTTKTQNEPTILIKTDKDIESTDITTPSISQVLAERNVIPSSNSVKKEATQDITTPSIAQILAMPQSQSVIENLTTDTENKPTVKTEDSQPKNTEVIVEKPVIVEPEVQKTEAETDTKDTVKQEKQEIIVLEPIQPKFTQKAQTVINNDYIVPNSYIAAKSSTTEVLPDIKVENNTDTTPTITVKAPTDTVKEEKGIEDFKITYNDDKNLKPILAVSEQETDIDSVEKTQELKEFIAQAPEKDVTEYSETFATSVEDKKAIAAGIASKEILDLSEEREEQSAPKIVMAKSAPVETTLAKANETSMAKVLALSAVTSMSENAKLLAADKENIVKSAENDEQNIIVKDKENIIATVNANRDFVPNSYIAKENSNLTVDNSQKSITISTPEKKETETFNITYNKPESNIIKTVDNNLVQKANDITSDTEKTIDGFKTVATEIKERPNFDIKYNKPAEVQIATNNDKTQELLKEVAKINLEKEVDTSVKSLTKPQESISEISNKLQPEINKINEKYAEVNLNEINVTPQKTLQIKPEDEIVLFEPESFIAKAAENVFEKNNLSNSDSTTKLPQEYSKIINNITESSKESEKIKQDTEKLAQAVIETEKEKEISLVTPENIEGTTKTKLSSVKQEVVPTVVPKLRTQKAITEDTEKEAELAQRVADTLKEETQQEEWLWDFLHNKENPSNNITKDSEQKAKKGFFKKLRKAKKQAQDGTISESVVQNTISDETNISKSQRVKAEKQNKVNKNWFAKKDKTDSDSIKQIKTKSEKIKTEKQNRWFKKNNSDLETVSANKKAATSETKINNEKKKFQWWRKKEKTNTTKPVKTKTQKLQNNETSKKRTLKNIFSKKSQSTEVTTKNKTAKPKLKFFKKDKTNIKNTNSEQKIGRFWFKKKKQ